MAAEAERPCELLPVKRNVWEQIRLFLGDLCQKTENKHNNKRNDWWRWRLSLSQLGWSRWFSLWSDPYEVSGSLQTSRGGGGCEWRIPEETPSPLSQTSTRRSVVRESVCLWRWASSSQRTDRSIRAEQEVCLSSHRLSGLIIIISTLTGSAWGRCLTKVGMCNL